MRIHFLVEPAYGKKDVIAYRSAPGPEASGLFSRNLMNVVMEQILVLGKEIGRLWLLVIRTKQGRQVWIFFEIAENQRDGVLCHSDVRINEQQDRARGLFCAGVSGSGRPPAPV